MTEQTWQDAVDVGAEQSREQWAEAARPILVDVAGRYNALVTYKELAAEVQTRSGVHTKQMTHHWLADVLRQVSVTGESRGEPLLAALCVNDSGSVGNNYQPLVEELRGTPIGDPDDHAAAERLECYRRFGAEIPADGGRPALAQKLSASRSRARKQAYDERVIPVCPKCLLAVPANGVCDDCN